MKHILKNITSSKRTIGILVDPEKTRINEIAAFAKAVDSIKENLKVQLQIDNLLILVGGSTMKGVNMDQWVHQLKSECNELVVLFPGTTDQITEKADALLFLSLLSGRNIDYVVSKQVEAAPKLINSTLEIIPTSYLLIDGGNNSAVQRVTKTLPLSQNNPDIIAKTAFAGQLMGHQLAYLEAGSGAYSVVSNKIIRECKNVLQIPIIVGGGMRRISQLDEAFKAGASMVVVGTAIEENLSWKG